MSKIFATELQPAEATLDPELLVSGSRKQLGSTAAEQPSQRSGVQGNGTYVIYSSHVFGPHAAAQLLRPEADAPQAKSSRTAAAIELCSMATAIALTPKDAPLTTGVLNGIQQKTHLKVRVRDTSSKRRPYLASCACFVIPVLPTCAGSGMRFVELVFAVYIDLLHNSERKSRLKKAAQKCMPNDTGDK